MAWIASPETLRAFLFTSARLHAPSPSRVLMVAPDFFRIEYSINPYMTDASGRLKKVDTALAAAEWRELVATYTRLGKQVVVLPADPALPDMVFAANQSFPFWDESAGRPAVIMSRMRSPQRAPEVAQFQSWYEAEGYLVLNAPTHVFEGNGDCLADPSYPLLWGGYGPRTELAVYSDISRRTGFSVAPLELVDPDFYHLDTCFSLLGPDTAAVFPGALSPSSLALVRERFSTIVELDRAECRDSFAGNCHWVGGKDVVLHPGSLLLENKLKALGYSVHPVPTSEFLKAGGSVFCLKMMCF